MSIFDSEKFWDNSTFYLFIIGLCGEVLIAIVAAILVHVPNLSESRKRKFHVIIEWSAVICAVLIVLAIISERIHGEILKRDIAQEFQEINNRFPRSMTLMQQRGVESMINMEPNKPSIIIFQDEQVPDAEDLGNQLANVFAHAGFAVHFQGGLVPSDWHGITVGEYGQTSRSMFEIYGALKWCGFEVTTNGGVSNWPTQIVVTIANVHKPD